MRNYNPADESDLKESAKLKAQPWQLETLSYNPKYVYWGNGEDYMWDSDSHWGSSLTYARWSERFNLDELNEVVNFYFFIHREGHNCPNCGGSGLNPATQKLSDDWYSFSNERYVDIDGRRRYNDNAWQYHLTEVEVEALVKDDRLGDLVGQNCHYDDESGKWFTWIKNEKIEIEQPAYPTPEAVNNWAKIGFGHDAINRWICVRARAESLGVYGHCQHCVEGTVYDEPEAKLGLQLWVLHPRKGASRGIQITDIHEDELPDVYKYLHEAAERNANRFSQIPKL